MRTLQVNLIKKPLIIYDLFLLAMLFLTLPSACGQYHAAENILADYLERVEKTTGVDGQNHLQVAMVPYPSHRERTLLMKKIRIGMTDFLKFYDCELFNLISERNSIMGKLMPVSQRLIYEVRFLHQGEVCYAELVQTKGLNEEFLAAFTEILRAKRANLPIIFWNATFDSPELQKAFSLAVKPLAPGEQTAYAQSLQSIRYFYELGRKLQHVELNINQDELEEQYFTLQSHQYGGRLLQSVKQLIEYLNQAANALEVLFKDQPVCYQQKSTPTARILKHIFTKYYVGRIGPYLSQIHQQGKNWLGEINRLVAVQEIQMPMAFAEYQAQMLSLKEGLWRHFDNAIHRHTQAWQVILSQCGFVLGSEDSDFLHKTYSSD